MRRAKKLLAMLLSLALLLSFIPVNVARADGGFELSFSVSGGNHTITVEEGHLKIDGGFVELRDNNNLSIGVATSTGENTAKITVQEGLTGKLNYGGQNFTLYESGHPFNIDTNISGNMNFGVQNYENGGGNGGGGGNDDVDVQFDNNATISGNEITFTLNVNGTDTAIKATVTGVGAGVAEWENSHLKISREHLNDVIFTFDAAFVKDQMSVNVIGADNWGMPLAVNGDNAVSLGSLNIPNGGIHFGIQVGGGGDNPPPEGNKRAVINLTGPSGSWQVAPMVREDYDVVTEEYSSAPYDKYAYTVVVGINDGWRTSGVNQYNKNDSAGYAAEFGSQNISYNREDTENKVSFDFFSNWGNRIESVKINGVSYNIPLNYDDRNAWLNSFGGQGIGFTIDNVPVSDTVDADNNEVYNVEVKVRPITEDECYIGNFLWSNDDRMDPEIAGNYNDMYIGHSNLELLSITYDDGTGEKTVDFADLHDENGNETLPFIHQTTNVSFETGIEMSEMVVPEGSWVTMKIETQYGYQVKSFNVTGEDIRLGNNQSVFSFRIGKGNFHIGAHVEKQEDEVKADAKAVSAGEVELAAGTLETGSARLEVEDAELNDEKEAAFEDEASESGYEIDSYLDIELNQVFYKGTGNSDDVWANPLEDLDKPATISLTLEDGIDSEDVALIHNIHDGKDFEVIEAESYDPETKTLTFKTDSFSNYAIATKADAKTSTGTVSSDGILVLADSPSIVAGLVHAKSNAKDDVEFRWVACEENAGAWFEISPWTKNNEWLNWTPDEAGNYVIVGYARVVGNEEKSLISKPVGVVYSKHVIKDICQIPYEDGYLIGFESTQNPNQSYQYEMLVMDLTLFAAGNPNCWILSTGRATVSEGNAIWITWKPEYGYYLTLFRVYDGNGKLLDQTCYGFANAY